jgi:hypothetical protein
MIEAILREVKAGTTSVRALSRKLGVERSALGGMLQYMVRRGLLRELHPECQPKGCRGCPYQGKCHTMPVVGYQLTEPGESKHA